MEKDPNLEVFHCPGDTKGIPPLLGNTYFDYYGTSYGMNGNLLGVDTMRPLPSITAPPSKLILETHITHVPHFVHGGTVPRGRTMVLFLDGHVHMQYFDHDFDGDGTDGYDTSKDVYVHPNE